MATQFNGTLSNPGIARLSIGVTGRDGKRAALEFKADNPAAPLVAIEPEPTPQDLAEMSAHFENGETPLCDEIYGGE